MTHAVRMSSSKPRNRADLRAASESAEIAAEEEVAVVLEEALGVKTSRREWC